MTLRVGIVVGEISGDNLAAPLIQSLRSLYPDLIFEGILGPKLLEAGGRTLYPMDRLSVMGFFAPLARLPELLRIRRHLIQHFCANPPDLFIGVDSPDFNLGIEKVLKKNGIPTVHYVSPSVWAWRKGRIRGIQKAVDLMLTLFPFEAKFYEANQIPVCFAGHPLADQIPLEIDTKQAKRNLGFQEDAQVIAVLPGSRHNELKYLAEIFILTANRCFKKNKNLQFIVPLVSEEHRNYFENLCHKIAPEMPIKIIRGNAERVIAAADAVLVTSGTATLEVLLHKKPMVVAYRMHPLTYQIAKRLVKIPYIALPNLLVGEALVPEFIQAAATPENLSAALMKYLEPSYDRKKLVDQFRALHLTLKQDASFKAAEAIHRMLDRSK